MLAQINSVIRRPDFLTGIGGLPEIIGWLLRLFFVAAGLMVVYQLLYGGFEWIQSTGDKEKVEKARKRIVNAIIGLVILFATIAIIIALESIFNFGLGFTKSIYIPVFGQP